MEGVDERGVLGCVGRREGRGGEAERQRGREAERQRDRERERERQTDRPLVMLALPRDARAMKLRIATVDDYWSLQKKKNLFLLFLREFMLTIKKMRIAAVDNYRKGKIYAFDK